MAGQQKEAGHLGLAREAEIKRRLDGQESTSFSERSSWSVDSGKVRESLSREHSPVVSGLYVAFDPI